MIGFRSSGALYFSTYSYGERRDERHFDDACCLVNHIPATIYYFAEWKTLLIPVCLISLNTEQC